MPTAMLMPARAVMPAMSTAVMPAITTTVMLAVTSAKGTAMPGQDHHDDQEFHNHHR
jgi:hypothetical protein